LIKSQLIQRIAAQNPHPFQRDIEKIVNIVLATIVDALARGNRVELRGFGEFSVRFRPTLEKGAWDDQSDDSAWAVMQAGNCLAGVWANRGQAKWQFIESGDVESALQTASAIGDDRLQRGSQGYVSAQRTRWFMTGLKPGPSRGAAVFVPSSSDTATYPGRFISKAP
jgi:hypothetical protein